MTQQADMIEPDYWLTNHGRALRTSLRVIGLQRNRGGVRGLARRIAVTAWNYPGDSPRELINRYRARYGK